MIVFRLSTLKFPYLSGEGAKINGGRWNLPGTPAIYCAMNRSLAMLEVLVHANTDILSPRILFTIQVPDNIEIFEFHMKALTHDWQKLNSRTAEMGDKIFNVNEFCAIKVPSVLVPDEYNYILNPLHKNFKDIKVKQTQQIKFDHRFTTLEENT